MRWRVYPIRDFDRFTSPWDALNAASGDVPFLRSEFLGPALREFGAGTEVLAALGGEYRFSTRGRLYARH